MESLAIPQQSEWAIMKEQAALAIKSRYLPDAIKTPEQAIIIMLKGREIGIGPMQAFSQIHVIKGKPAVSAELQLALIKRAYPNFRHKFPKYDDKEVTIDVWLKGEEKDTKDSFTWNLKDAERAGLLSNNTWKQYPKAMLRSRVISEMARAKFPEALMGCSYTPEELGAEVNDEGEVVSVSPSSAALEIPTTKAVSTYEATPTQKVQLVKALQAAGIEDKNVWKSFSEKFVGKPMDSLEDEITTFIYPDA